MIKSKEIFAPDIKKHTIKKLDSLGFSSTGTQTKNKTEKEVDIAIYDKGQRQIRQGKESSFIVSTIKIFSTDPVLNFNDEIPFNDLDHIVVEVNNRSDYSFYKAVANV